MATLSFATGQPVEHPAPAPAAPIPKPEPLRLARGTEQRERRKAMLAKVHLAKAQRAMSEDEYRTMLSDRYGVDSAADLTDKQLHSLLLYLQELGAKFTRGSARKRSGKADRKRDIPATLEHDDASLGREAYMAKIEALLAEKGRVEGTHIPWGYAVSILKRQTGGVIKSFAQADVEQLRGVIAALTYDAKKKRRYTGTWGEK